jgi:hypothetical protein
MRLFVRYLLAVVSLRLHKATGVALQRLQFFENGLPIAHDGSLSASRLFRIDVNQASYLSRGKTVIVPTRCRGDDSALI